MKLLKAYHYTELHAVGNNTSIDQTLERIQGSSFGIVGCTLDWDRYPQRKCEKAMGKVKKQIRLRSKLSDIKENKRICPRR